MKESVSNKNAVVFFILSIIMYSNTTFGIENWVHFSSDKNGSQNLYAIDHDKKANDSITTKMRTIILPEDEKNRLVPKGSYYIFKKFIINCKNNTYKKIESRYEEKSGNLVKNLHEKNQSSMEKIIVKGTTLESLADVACNQESSPSLIQKLINNTNWAKINTTDKNGVEYLMKYNNSNKNSKNIFYGKIEYPQEVSSISRSDFDFGKTNHEFKFKTEIYKATVNCEKNNYTINSYTFFDKNEQAVSQFIYNEKHYDPMLFEFKEDTRNQNIKKHVCN